MEKAEIKYWESEGEEEEEIEGLQVRRSTNLPINQNSNYIEEYDEDDHSDYNNRNVDIYSGVDDQFVSEASEELKSSDNGGTEEEEKADSKEEVDLKNSEKCVFNQNGQGTESTTGLSSNGHSSIECTAPEKINGDSEVDGTLKSSDIGLCLSLESELEHEKQHGSLSGSSLLTSKISPEEDKTSLNFSSYKAIQSSDTNLLYESDHEATELDVERVLRKQDTHDLYCPNCNSCITRRVIIRKRKRTLPNSGEDGKRNKIENVTGPGIISTSVATTSNPSHSTVDTCLDGSGAPASYNDDQDYEPDVFRCLSCFSIFVPTGNGFKLFRMCGDRSDKDNLQDPPQAQVLKKSWFSTLFQSDKRASGRAAVETDDTEVLIPTNSTRQNGSVSSIHESSSHAQTDLDGEPVKTGIKESIKGGTYKLISLQKVSRAEPGSLDNFKDQVSMNLNKENGETSLNEAPSNAIYADGESVRSEITESKEGGSKVLSPLSKGFTDYELLLNHEGEHLEINPAGSPPTTAEEAAETSTFRTRENGLKFFIPSDVNSFTVEASQTDQKVNATIPNKSSDEKETAFLLQTPVSFLEESYTDSKVNISSHISPQNEQNSGASLLSKFATKTQNGEVTTNNEEKIHHSEVSQHSNTCKMEVYTNETFKADQSAPVSLNQNTLLLEGRQVNLSNTLKDTAANKISVGDTIVIVETSQIESSTAQRVQDLPIPAESGTLQHLETLIQINEQRGMSTVGIQGLEIIKSIVYGGLVESIASLGVVSSAAGSDAATLNVVALGLANLIGGLIIIGHNLWELKNDKKTEASDQLDERVDRYHELLGHRRNFLRHAFFAILSFLTFGLIPPVSYGFSFRKSDDRDLKLVIVAEASLLAIIILAAGKAYVKRTPKSYLKTVLYYVVMGLMVSGISYEVGNLINMFLEKLGVFQSSLIVTLPETRLMKPAWASY